jgi:hypothetical protein
MDYHEVQKKLEALYSDWKATLRLSDEEADSLFPPYLLSVTEDYCRADRRVLVYGQETGGWGWDEAEQAKRSSNPNAWMFQDIWSCRDFLTNPDSVAALCWAYREFQFGASHPSTFWRAFKDIRKWSSVGAMASNVIRMAYMSPDGKNRGFGIRHAPQSLRDSLLSQQTSLVVGELAILDPCVCLFLSGPNYDGFIKTIFPGCEFIACGGAPEREFARLVHSALPRSSFRTYHPASLNRQRLWRYIDDMRRLLP